MQRQRRRHEARTRQPVAGSNSVGGVGGGGMGPSERASGRTASQDHAGCLYILICGKSIDRKALRVDGWSDGRTDGQGGGKGRGTLGGTGGEKYKIQDGETNKRLKRKKPGSFLRPPTTPVEGTRRPRGKHVRNLPFARGREHISGTGSSSSLSSGVFASFDSVFAISSYTYLVPRFLPAFG